RNAAFRPLQRTQISVGNRCASPSSLFPASSFILFPMRTRTNNLPFVFLNIATTADGKLAPANRVFIPFGSRRDQEHLLELRATADAVMSGARTVTGDVKMGTGGPKYRRMRLKRGLAEYNLRIIVSGSGAMDPQAEIFKHRFSPIIVLTTARASKSKLR